MQRLKFDAPEIAYLKSPHSPSANLFAYGMIPARLFSQYRPDSGTQWPDALLGGVQDFHTHVTFQHDGNGCTHLDAPMRTTHAEIACLACAVNGLGGGWNKGFDSKAYSSAPPKRQIHDQTGRIKFFAPLRASFQGFCICAPLRPIIIFINMSRSPNIISAFHV